MEMDGIPSSNVWGWAFVLSPSPFSINRGSPKAGESRQLSGGELGDWQPGLCQFFSAATRSRRDESLAWLRWLATGGMCADSWGRRVVNPESSSFWGFQYHPFMVVLGMFYHYLISEPRTLEFVGPKWKLGLGGDFPPKKRRVFTQKAFF